MIVTHAKVSVIADSNSADLVQPSDWNSSHVIKCSSGVILGRASSGTGDVEEIPAANVATLIGAQPLDGDLTAIGALVGTSGFLKKTAANTWALDTNSYLTANQSITVSGDASGSGATSIALTLANSGVTAGTYNSVTVDAKGRVTAGVNNAYLTANQTVTLSGDVTGSGSTAITATLANSGVTAGTYPQVTVNAKGLVTGGTYGNAPVTKTTTTYTLAVTDTNLICNPAAAMALTLPAAASYPGKSITIKTIAAFAITSASSNVVPLTSATAGTAILAATAGKWATLVSDGTNWVIMAGN